jgi:hypothetical protein
MSSTKAAETSTAYRSLRPGQFSPAEEIPGSAGNDLPRAYTSTAGESSAGRFNDFLTAGETDFTPDEFNELKIFGEFLSKHVQLNRSCDVQCMLLWSEWVRMFRRQVSGFPDLVREREFRAMITGTFGVGIATDGMRGAVYPGLKFFP